jgi:hypothetical protein
MIQVSHCDRYSARNSSIVTGIGDETVELKKKFASKLIMHCMTG